MSCCLSRTMGSRVYSVTSIEEDRFNLDFSFRSVDHFDRYCAIMTSLTTHSTSSILYVYVLLRTMHYQVYGNFVFSGVKCLMLHAKQSSKLNISLL